MRLLLSHHARNRMCVKLAISSLLVKSVCLSHHVRNLMFAEQPRVNFDIKAMALSLHARNLMFAKHVCRDGSPRADAFTPRKE